MSAKVMCDLFCGTRYGWTKGFLAQGWTCKGIDIVPVPDYPGEFIQADIAHLIELPRADFYCCSSPCENFTVHQLPYRQQNKKWPWLGIALFRRAQELLEATGKPYVMENVHSAQRFVGRSVNHCGPFHLWGNSVPAIMPKETYLLTKGTKYGNFTMIKKRDTSKVAEVPLPISAYIAQMAGYL